MSERFGWASIFGQVRGEFNNAGSFSNSILKGCAGAKKPGHLFRADAIMCAAQRVSHGERTQKTVAGVHHMIVIRRWRIDNFRNCRPIFYAGTRYRVF